MIVVTGATGKLGRLVVEQLLKTVAPGEITAAVRTPSKAADLAARGVVVKEADYTRPATLDAALAGAQKVLLISSSEVGQRASHHQSVIAAAKKAGVKLLAYTSILRADSNRMALAGEHKATEEMIKASGVPWVMLRHGWYLENHTENLAPALQYGAMMGSAGEGRFASASRADFAAADAAVLVGDGHAGKTYELAGDHPFTMAQLAAEVARQAGKPVVYNNLPPAEYLKVLAGAGLPGPFAEILVDADVHAAQGALDDTSGSLHALTGRSTTTLKDAVAAGLKR
ncbi:MAG: SDR family oxidoreductase [Deltaproteobacteria bacterium]|nr:SDR family oxidoreductase [Deltaproteobacteria bacterium]